VPAVWLFVVTVVAAVVIVLFTAGRFGELANLRFSAWWLLAMGLALQIVLELVDIPKDQFDTIGYGALMASYAFILAFCFANVSIRGMGVIAIGVALNALVIGLNQGMPTVAIGNDAHGNRVQKPVERTVKHRPERDGDLLQFLDDQIVLPKPLDSVVSFGDLVLAVGVCELAYYGTRRKRRRRGTQSVRTTSRAPGRRASTRSSAPSTRPS